MKRCPSCQRTYPDDSPDYCPNDGMRLVNEEAAAFDPEKTVMSSGQRSSEPMPQASQPTAETPPEQQTLPPGAPPPPEQSSLPGDQPPPSWQQQPGNQYAPQPQGWSPSPPPQAPQPAPAWESPYQQPQANAPYGAPYSGAPPGRSRALAIAALAFGTNAINIMLIRLITGMPYYPYRRIKIPMGVLSIGGIGLGIAALILALRNPTRFGGVELSIVGLATGTAALVYMLLN